MRLRARSSRRALAWVAVGVVTALSCGRWSSLPAGVEPGDAGSAAESASGNGGSGARADGGESGAPVAVDGGAPTMGAGGTGGNGGVASSAGGTRPGNAGESAESGAGGSGGTNHAGRGGTNDAGRGSAGTPDEPGGAAGMAPLGPCGFDIDTQLSPMIGTVAVVRFVVNMDVLESASIEFGLDESYGVTAPVDLDEPGHRTLLLGMKPSRDYHYRIVASGGGEECDSGDLVVTTEPRPVSLRSIAIDTYAPESLAGGFIVTSGLTRGPAFILDADGEYVWWFGEGADVGRAEMSSDGRYMWYTSINVSGGNARFRRVSMDGLDDRTFDEFGEAHHDFTVLPDDTVAFIQHVDRCDRIMERAPDGSVREIINVHDAHGGVTMCHTNSIHYHPADDSYTFSDLNQNAYVKVKRTGEVVWVLGGDTSQFTGDGASWIRQHGHYLVAPDRLLFFNNRKTPATSLAVEVSLDLENMTATKVWEYDGGYISTIYGDVERLENGNTLVTYSTSNQMQEVSPTKELVRVLRWDAAGGVGYAMQRASLYGPPPQQ